jgi:ubiquinone/menaquinone biosynthesis C-methylase UbiE
MSRMQDDLRAAASATPGVYERQASSFDAARSKGLHERTWLHRFTSGLPPRGRLLDLWCGSGDPIAAYLSGLGFRVVGMDLSHAMLDLARRRFPQGDWRHGDMRALDLPGERFDGMLGWNSFFHLAPDEQRAALPRFADHLAPGGALMLTVGPAAGETLGRVGGEPVYHASLAPDEYERILDRLGLSISHFVKQDPACASQTVLLARRLTA